ncbi:RusA family crossover junction endodeoxyribonuclease [Micromonospora sp. NPDC047548]|uniref:RusA family crossover junction endodeoxyribonuclease n=1 Tax=Micromonospora sp. NPDC047548 TaxID=3155624 RepID=UPI00340040BD
MTELRITVHGLPAPQGSKRHVGNGVMIESSKKVKPWREAVKTAARDAVGDDWRPLDEPLLVSIVFTMPKPASAPKRRRTWPMRTPDLSKLIRSTEDALTDAGIWRDDARVVGYRETRKEYPMEGPYSLASPGAVIRIWRLEELAADDAPPAPAGADTSAGLFPVDDLRGTK